MVHAIFGVELSNINFEGAVISENLRKQIELEPILESEGWGWNQLFFDFSVDKKVLLEDLKKMLGDLLDNSKEESSPNCNNPYCLIHGTGRRESQDGESPSFLEIIRVAFLQSVEDDPDIPA
jgi:hypothetical protein